MDKRHSLGRALDGEASYQVSGPTTQQTLVAMASFGVRLTNY